MEFKRAARVAEFTPTPELREKVAADLKRKNESKKIKEDAERCGNTGEKLFKCKDCGRAYSRRNYLLRHRQIHTRENLFECDDCGKKFKKIKYLKEHELTHTGEKRFKCEDCGKAYTSRNNLIQHVRIHTGELLKCDICDKEFWPGFGTEQNNFRNARG